MKHLTLVELSTSERVELSEDERDALALLVPSMTIAPRLEAPGTYDITPDSRIGAVRIGQRSITILPKIPVDRVLFLLSYSLFREQWKAQAIEAEPDHDIVEAIVHGFLNQVDRVVRRGLLHGYRTEEDALATIKGRIRFNDQIRDRFGIAPPIEVIFDDFTVDIEENRLLKAALNSISGFRFRSQKLRRQLFETLSVMPGVSAIQYSPTQIPEVMFTRLNEHYRPAIALANLILRGSSHDIRHGRLKSSAFLFDMNVVFEDFVVCALRDGLGLPERAFPQGAAGWFLTLDVPGRLRLYPDISWWEAGRCTFVGDVKYKRTKSGGDALHPDLYQVLAYSVAANLPGGLLIYAAGEGRAEPHVVRNVGKTLEVMAIDLAGQPDAILAHIVTIAHRVKLMRCSVGSPQFPPAA